MNLLSQRRLHPSRYDRGLIALCGRPRLVCDQDAVRLRGQLPGRRFRVVASMTGRNPDFCFVRRCRRFWLAAALCR
jgi:hypothetical protein